MYGTTLKVKSLSPKVALFQSLAQLAPLPTLIFTIQEIVGYSNAAALSYTIAVVIILFSANTVIQMGARFPHAGGYYAYVTNGISKSTGIYTQFLFLFYQIINTAGGVIFSSWVLQIFLGILGYPTRGFYLLFIPLILIFVIPYFGIKISGLFYIVTAAIEIILVASLAALMLMHSAPSSNFAVPFFPNVGISKFGLSIIYSLFFFTGYGSILTLAEETKSPKRSIPLMALASVIGIGILEFVFIFASEINWGTDKLGTFSTSSTFPTFIAARDILGMAGFVIIGIFAYVSLIKGSIAIQNAASRGLFAVGRDKILPKYFSSVHKKYGSPSGSIIMNEVITIIIIAATYLSFRFGTHITVGLTETSAIFLIAVLTIGYLLTHIFANISVPFYFIRKEKENLSLLKHIVFPLIATVAIIVAIYVSFLGLSGYMLALPVIVVLYLATTLIFVLWLRWKHPDIVKEAGNVIPELRRVE